MKTVIEMAIEAGLQEIVEQTATHIIVKNMDEAALERFAALVREDEREKFTAVGEVKDGSYGGFVWNEGITSDEAPDGAVLYIRSR